MEHWLYSIHLKGHILNFNLDTILTMWSAMLVLIIFAIIASKKISLVPGKLQIFCEAVMNFFRSTMGSMNTAKEHAPLVASLFLFILLANLMGQLPLKIISLKTGELASPTNDINLTAALAVIVLIYYVSAGIMKKKGKFFLHELSFTGIVMSLVELLEMVTRPLSLAIRLFANVFAGEILISIALGAFAYFAPLPIMIFEILVAFIQATVFMMLTIAYISSATGEEH